MDTPMIHTEIDSQGVAHICLDRPAQRNAFNPEMIEQIIDALARFEDEPCVRALALSARGEHFCAGADIGWMRRAATFTKAQNLADARRLAHLMSQLDRFSKPTIAQVQGSVFGGAIGLIACCDMVVASCDTRFCLSEVKLGLIPAVISPYLARVVGMRALRRYALSAEVIDAPAALQLGLVHHIEALPSTTVHQWLAKVCQNSGTAMASCKALLATIHNQEIDEHLIEYTAQSIAHERSSAQAREGLSAFLEKRSPKWEAVIEHSSDDTASQYNTRGSKDV